MPAVKSEKEKATAAAAHEEDAAGQEVPTINSGKEKAAVAEAQHENAAG